MQSERRAIPGFDGWHATEDGRIVSECRGVYHELRQRLGTDFRLYVSRRARGIPHPVPIGVHVLMALAYFGTPRGSRRLVRHLDGNPLNNRRDNLVWGNAEENSADRSRHVNRYQYRRLSTNDAMEIRMRLQNGEHPADFASLYDVYREYEGAGV